MQQGLLSLSEDNYGCHNNKCKKDKISMYLTNYSLEIYLQT